MTSYLFMNHTDDRDWCIRFKRSGRQIRRHPYSPAPTIRRTEGPICSTVLLVRRTDVIPLYGEPADVVYDGSSQSPSSNASPARATILLKYQVALLEPSNGTAE